MNGIIIYDEKSLEKNGFFAEKLKSELISLGIDASVVCPGRDTVTQKPDFAVMRVYDERINELLDERDIRTFNNSFVASIANDKWKTYELLKAHGLPVAPTQKAEEATMGYPRIVKARHGHGGSEVFWADNEEQFERARSLCRDGMIVQPPTGKRGRDLRVYIIGGKPVTAFLRKSDSDFRSNFSLGGSACEYELSAPQRKLVRSVCSLFAFDFAGVDFLLDEDGGLIVNEIEDVVGCRMVYAYSDIDIIKKYSLHIARSVKNA